MKRFLVNVGRSLRCYSFRIRMSEANEAFRQWIFQIESFSLTHFAVVLSASQWECTSLVEEIYAEIFKTVPPYDKLCKALSESKGSSHCRLQACQIKSALLPQRFSKWSSTLISHHAFINNNWAISSSKDKQLDVTRWKRQTLWISDSKEQQDKFSTSPVVVI